jgi:heme-degrading monooxygenase HmoA
MFARVVTAQMKKEYLDEAVQIYEESIVAYARGQEGFREIRLLSDRETGKMISITLWETEEDMLAGERSSYLRDQFARLIGFLVAQPTTEHFQVVVEG